MSGSDRPGRRRPRSSRLGAVRSLLLVCVVTLFVAGCTSDEALPDPVAEPTARIDRVAVASTSSVVGEPVSVDLYGSGPGVVRVDVVDAFAISTFEVELTGEVTSFDVPDELLTASGRLRVDVTGISGSATTSVRLIPLDGSAADVHVAPRSIVAGGSDSTMATAIVVDRFGNLLPDSTDIEFRVDDSTGDPLSATTPVSAGVAPLTIESGLDAGPVDVFVAGVGDAASGRSTFQVVAGAAVATGLVLPEEPGDGWRADGGTVVEIRTAEIVDPSGNVVPDGHQVRLVVEGPDGSGRLGAKTIDGIARFDVVLPSAPGTLTMAASIDGVSGAASTVDVLPAVSGLPVSVGRAGGDVVIEVGPVVDHDGALVDDLTQATIATGSTSTVVELRDGVASLIVDGDTFDGTGDSSVVEVSVLGVVTRVEVAT